MEKDFHKIMKITVNREAMTTETRSYVAKCCLSDKYRVMRLARF